MDALVKKDTNLTYKMEGSGKQLNYLDLDLNIKGGELQIIFRKVTHVWDLPKWTSRTPTPTKEPQ